MPRLIPQFRPPEEEARATTSRLPSGIGAGGVSAARITVSLRGTCAADPIASVSGWAVAVWMKTGPEGSVSPCDSTVSSAGAIIASVSGCGAVTCTSSATASATGSEAGSAAGFSAGRVAGSAAASCTGSGSGADAAAGRAVGRGLRLRPAASASWSGAPARAATVAAPAAAAASFTASSSPSSASCAASTCGPAISLSALAISIGGSGFCVLTRLGARSKPRSSSSAIIELRAAGEVPPKIVAMMRLLPRCAEAVRLKPAGTV